MSLWILEEGGVRTGNTFAAEPEPKSMPTLAVSTGLYLLRAIAALAFVQQVNHPRP